MNAKMKRCTRCLMPDTYPGVVFDESGVCNQCLEHRGPVPLGEEALIEKVRTGAGSKGYDCLLGISGGKDSCYVAYLAKERFNFRALAVCYDFPFLVDLARENIRRVCDSLNLELVVIKTKNNLEYRLLKNHLTSLAATSTTWGQCMFCHYGIDAVLYNEAKKREIPFILSGVTRNELWNPGSRTKFLLKRVKALPIDEMMKHIFYQSRAYLGLVNQRMQFPIPGNSRLSAYKKANLPADGPETVRVFDYVEWDGKVIEKTLKERTGWTRPEGEISWRYDCMLEPLLDYTYKREFGISSTGVYLCGLIRSGLIEREDALKALASRENEETLQSALVHVLDFLEIPEKVKSKFLESQ